TDPLAVHAIAPDMNGEGRWVVFFSTETVPTQGDNNGLTTGDVFLYDRLTNETKILTDEQHIPAALRAAGERFEGFAISGDGYFSVIKVTSSVTDQFATHEANKVYIYDREHDRVTLLADPNTHDPIISDGNVQINGNGSLITFVRFDNSGLSVVAHVSVYNREGALLTDITAANNASIPDTLDHFQNASISNYGR